MKVLLINGSPHEKGCTYTALCAAADSLEQNGIGCSFVLQDGVCRITLADPARQSEASELLEKNSGTLPWELTAEGGETP